MPVGIRHAVAGASLAALAAVTVILLCSEVQTGGDIAENVVVLEQLSTGDRTEKNVGTATEEKAHANKAKGMVKKAQAAAVVHPETPKQTKALVGKANAVVNTVKAAVSLVRNAKRSLKKDASQTAHTLKDEVEPPLTNAKVQSLSTDPLGNSQDHAKTQAALAASKLATVTDLRARKAAAAAARLKARKEVQLKAAVRYRALEMDHGFAIAKKGGVQAMKARGESTKKATLAPRQHLSPRPTPTTKKTQTDKPALLKKTKQAVKATKRAMKEVKAAQQAVRVNGRKTRHRLARITRAGPQHPNKRKQKATQIMDRKAEKQKARRKAAKARHARKIQAGYKKAMEKVVATTKQKKQSRRHRTVGVKKPTGQLQTHAVTMSKYTRRVMRTVKERAERSDAAVILSKKEAKHRDRKMTEAFESALAAAGTHPSP